MIDEGDDLYCGRGTNAVTKLNTNESNDTTSSISSKEGNVIYYSFKGSYFLKNEQVLQLEVRIIFDCYVDNI
jgi:hypothetical protein